MKQTITTCDVCRMRLDDCCEYVIDVPIARVEPPISTTRPLEVCGDCLRDVCQQLLWRLFRDNEEAGREFYCGVYRTGDAR